MKDKKRELSDKIEKHRLFLNDLYKKEGVITSQVLLFSQILDRLISEYCREFGEW